MTEITNQKYNEIRNSVSLFDRIYPEIIQLKVGVSRDEACLALTRLEEDGFVGPYNSDGSKTIIRCPAL
jgi:ribosomal protein S25